MKKKIIVTGGLCVALICALLSGCGSNPSTQTDTEVTTEVTSVDTETTVEGEETEKESIEITQPSFIDRSAYKTSSTVKLPDYSKIELNKADVEMTDEVLEQYLENFRNYYATTKSVKEGEVKDGDTVNISYVGKIDGKEFEGGTQENTELEIGSNYYIEGFESGLVGVKVGESKTLNLKFPEDYAEEYAGKDVVFDVTVNSIEMTEVPELTDELVKEHSMEYLKEQVNNVNDFKTTLKRLVEHSATEQALATYLEEKSEIKIDENDDMFKELTEYFKNTLDVYAETAEVDAEEYAKQLGAESAEAYAKEQATSLYEQVLLYDTLAKELNISSTDEEADASIEKFMESQGYTEQYSLEEFKKINGATWQYFYNALEVNGHKVLEALKKNIVLK